MDKQGAFSMFASSYPVLDAFLTMLYFFLFIIWIWLLIMVFMDVFRSHDMGGLAKAVWVIFIIILPFLGVFVYLIARGGKMHERAAQQAAQQQKAFDQYVKQAAGTPGASSADQLAKLADLKTSGVLTDAEFEAQKAKILAS
jgi:ABC-type multidrug transport system fused ATPase/permease subunit